MRSLDLATWTSWAASRGGTVPSAASLTAEVARILSGSSGLSFSPARSEDASDLPEPDFEAVVSVGSGRLRVLVDRMTRQVWLAAVLGVPAENHPGVLEMADLPAEPSPLERAVFVRSLLEPLVEAWRASGRIGADLGVEPAAIEFRPADEPVADFGVFSAPVAAGQAVIRVGLSAGPLERRSRVSLDRAIRSAEVPLVVTLDPVRSGLFLRAADLVRLEPGDVLITDLPPGPDGTLPVEVGARTGRSGRPEGPSGPVSGGLPFRNGRLGTAGARRGVRFGLDGP